VSKFESGHAIKGGRPVGARNRLTSKFIEALAADFDLHGDAAIRITRVEKPAEYLKLIAGLLPKEFAISDAKLGDMSEEEVAALLETVRELRAKTLAAETSNKSDETPRDSIH
jgi:hypothetical protein